MRHLSPENWKIAAAEFEITEEMGTVRRSTSPGASPLHMMLKGNGEWRPCGDYRRLNQRTIPDWYPIPFLMDCVSKSAGCSSFSRIDLFRLSQSPSGLTAKLIGSSFPSVAFSRAASRSSVPKQRYAMQRIAQLEYKPRLYLG